MLYLTLQYVGDTTVQSQRNDRGKHNVEVYSLRLDFFFNNEFNYSEYITTLIRN